MLGWSFHWSVPGPVKGPVKGPVAQDHGSACTRSCTAACTPSRYTEPVHRPGAGSAAVHPVTSRALPASGPDSTGDTGVHTTPAIPCGGLTVTVACYPAAFTRAVSLAADSVTVPCYPCTPLCVLQPPRRAGTRRTGQVVDRGRSAGHQRYQPPRRHSRLPQHQRYQPPPQHRADTPAGRVRPASAVDVVTSRLMLSSPGYQARPDAASANLSGATGSGVRPGPGPRRG